MNKTEALKQLRAMGTAQYRKVYARHGVVGPSFGVSYANLGKLKKSIGVDHELARALWASGNHDARVLATMIADPEAVTATDLDTWARQLDSYPLTDAFSNLAASSPLASKRVAMWTGSKQEWESSAGWILVARLALADGALPDSVCEKHLKTIESKIHKAPNRTRYAMNGALIAIGMRSAALGKEATAAAKRIGKVEVDHGETGCKTPDAATYIQKAAARKRR